MRFSVSLPDLQKVLQKTLPALPPKSTLPVLEHIHCTAANGVLTMIATDQELTISSSIAAFADAEGQALIPARRFNEIVKALGNEGTVEIAVSDQYDVALTTSSGKFSMKSMNPEEYPTMPDFPEGAKVSFSKIDVSRIADKTVFAVSSEEYRPAMTGVLFQFRGNHVRAAATDSYRLSRVIVRAAADSADAQPFPADHDVIVPSRTMELLRKADNDVTMSVNKTHAEFVMGATTITTRIIDERFPPYENVIPKDNDKEVHVNPTELIGAIKRVAIFTSSKSHQIRLKISEEGLLIRGEDDETGSSAQEQIHCDYSGETFEIGFNYRYVAEALQHLEPDEKTGEALFTFSTPTRAALVKSNADNDDLLMLIMPTRI